MPEPCWGGGNNVDLAAKDEDGRAGAEHAGAREIGRPGSDVALHI